ncbi:GNAT family N-acetyltransferase [Nocardioides phosphati]|uniref:GNAT family N-acetyltransferase n=1 Tax=Nocardioides phosphati TaxID=1867775 RepID=UPI00227C2E33|nr:GNAT family N-acetyltransferase [Nocardioides phosphati]
MGEWEIERATADDAGELLTLQRACWVDEAIHNDFLAHPALHEDVEDVRAWLAEWDTWVVRRAGRLVGAVRARLDGDAWDIGRLMVAPDLQGNGLGRVLLQHAEAVAPKAATSYVLFTGAASFRNQRLYQRAGFRLRPDVTAPEYAVVMTKPVRRKRR